MFQNGAVRALCDLLTVERLLRISQDGQFIVNTRIDLAVANLRRAISEEVEARIYEEMLQWDLKELERSLNWVLEREAPSERVCPSSCETCAPECSCAQGFG